MLLWLIGGVLTAAVVIAVVRPLRAPRGASSDEIDADVALYRAQLKELDGDIARGVLAAAEADGARVEITRRLLRRDGAGTPQCSAPVARDRAWLAAAACAGGVPLVALSLYLAIGSPGLPGRPRADLRLDRASIGELVAQVEGRLRERPEDGTGWDVIAPVYLKQERFEDAAQAYGRALRLLGDTPRRLAGFAEATILVNNGIVTEAARQAYEKILALEPERIEPRFWLALAKEQDGDLAAAAAAYRGLLGGTAADAPWRAAVEERLRAVAARLAGDNAAGPSADDVAAADKLDPEGRARMIREMVDGLAARLKTNGRDLAGWQRLLRAYTVLGDKAKAARALAEARAALAGDTAALAALSDVARELGLGS